MIKAAHEKKRSSCTRREEGCGLKKGKSNEKWLLNYRWSHCCKAIHFHALLANLFASEVVVEVHELIQYPVGCQLDDAIANSLHEFVVGTV